MYNQLVAGVMLPIYSTVFLALLWGWDVSQKNGGFTRGSGDSNKLQGGPQFGIVKVVDIVSIGDYNHS